MNEKTQAERISAGVQAERELTLFGAAFDKARQKLLEAIAETPLEASAARERLYLAVQLIEPVRQFLVECISDGVAAQHEISMDRIMNPTGSNHVQ